MKNMKKSIALVLALVLVVGGVVGGTIAWLTDKTEEIKNTFTVGNIDIDLTETTGENYKMIPGKTLDKDPKVTVEAGSEDCWLFVEITESDNLDDFITYAPAAGWIPLEGNDGVYYREVAAAEADQEFAVLEGDEVTVDGGVTKAMMDAITEKTQPTLTFKAYAIQKEGFATAALAWAEVK